MGFEEFDPTDYSVVVKLRGNPPMAWKWEIYRACRWGPLSALREGCQQQSPPPEGRPVLGRVSAVAPLAHPPNEGRLRPCQSDSLNHGGLHELQQLDALIPLP